MYRQAAASDPNFAGAIVGMATTMGAICDWRGRGHLSNGFYIDKSGNLVDTHTLAEGQATVPFPNGWMDRLIEICTKQLHEAHAHAAGSIPRVGPVDYWIGLIEAAEGRPLSQKRRRGWLNTLRPYYENLEIGETQVLHETSFIIRLVEMNTRTLQRRWYIDEYGLMTHSIHRLPSIHSTMTSDDAERYSRPQLPTFLTAPPAVSVLPFHTVSFRLCWYSALL